MRFYAELIIYFILIINISRVFIIKRVKQDSLVILAPLGLLLAFLYFIAYGLSVFCFQLAVLCLLTLILNAHALWRMKDHLFIDHYSPVMKVSCAIVLITSISCLVFSFINRPVTLSNKDLDITVKEQVYEGGFRSGFKEPEVFSQRTLFIKEYRSNMVQPNPKNVVVFIPDVRGDTENYEPYLQLLASSGYTVCTADFFTKDCEWSYETNFLKQTRSYHLTKKSIESPAEFKKMEGKIAYNTKQGLQALTPFLKSMYGSNCKFFFVSDGISSKVVQDYVKGKNDLVSGTFFLDSIPEYKTSGYGCVEMTEPFVAKKLGIKKDKDGFITKYLVLKTSASIIDAWSDL